MQGARKAVHGSLGTNVMNQERKNVLGIMVSSVDYEGAVDLIFQAAREKRGIAVSALAVHGLMTGVLDREQKYRLNRFDLLVPDGQPVRWALNWLYRSGLSDRVYGPNLTIRVCAQAEAAGLPVFFYGSTAEILASLERSLTRKFPRLKIAGTEASRFRRLAPNEENKLAQRLKASGAGILFVGLGCPRQEVFAYELRDALGIPILAVGAAFPFIAGAIPQAPAWLQKNGLEWLFRMLSEPRRLWRRYVFLNPAYLVLLALQMFGLVSFPTEGRSPTTVEHYG
jgi:N-acetylglucosaminyldiphosphoundecaprenol N-acetyl-beta-D-mannosaminyltransferase